MNQFDLTGRVAVVTGGYGVLGGSIADGLASSGARVVILGRDRKAAAEKSDHMQHEGHEAMPVVADVLDEEGLRAVAGQVLDRWGRLDILVTAAGGNVARARTDGVPIFDLPFDAFDEVVRLNLHGSVYPSLVFGEVMADSGVGSIIHISSMASMRILSGVAGYSAAKAAIDNFTRWMAVELAARYGDGLRVNGVAPGFFISKQNEAVLRRADGSLTDRARRIIEHTPMGRFGRPDDLQGTVVWLASDASAFVTGAVIPVDGGFSVASGV